MNTPGPHLRHALLAAFALAALAGAAAWAFQHFELASWFQQARLRSLLTPLGPWAPVAFVVLFVGVVVFSLPSIAMQIAGGALFGFWGGLVLNVIGLNAGTCLAFLLARALGRPHADRLFGARWHKLAAYLERHGLATVTFVRFSGVLPLALVNYSAGLSRMSFGAYALGTLAGLLPGMAVYTYLGASLVKFELWKVGLAFGAIAALAVIAWLIRAARR